MRNTDAICALIDGADRALDPLDAVACRRAATWIRFTDAFGATITADEADRLAQGGALGEAARQIIQQLSEDYPAPQEDGSLRYLEDDEQDEGWMTAFRHIPRDPFRDDAAPRGSRDANLPAPGPK